jgi:biopolymer transport protein ExbD
MRFTRLKDEEPRLGMAPLIDIVFLLLIFFMLTSHFDIATGISIRLPKVAQNAFHKEDSKIGLTMDKAGNIYLKGEKIELSKLGLRLRGLVEKEGLVHLVLSADKDVNHGRVVQVMDIAKKAGVPSIIIAAQWDPEKVF